MSISRRVAFTLLHLKVILNRRLRCFKNYIKFSLWGTDFPRDTPHYSGERRPRGVVGGGRIDTAAIQRERCLETRNRNARAYSTLLFSSPLPLALLNPWNNVTQARHLSLRSQERLISSRLVTGFSNTLHSSYYENTEKKILVVANLTIQCTRDASVIFQDVVCHVIKLVLQGNNRTFFIHVHEWFNIHFSASCIPSSYSMMTVQNAIQSSCVR